jgi:hypothetical protein
MMYRRRNQRMRFVPLELHETFRGEVAGRDECPAPWTARKRRERRKLEKTGFHERSPLDSWIQPIAFTTS